MPLRRRRLRAVGSSRGPSRRRGLSDIPPGARNVAILVAIAATVFLSRTAFSAVGGTLLLIIRIAFIVAIIVFAIGLYRRHKDTIDTFSENNRMAILALGIGAVAGIIFGPLVIGGFAGLLLGAMIVGGCIYGIHRIWQQEQGGYYVS